MFRNSWLGRSKKPKIASGSQYCFGVCDREKGLTTSEQKANSGQMAVPVDVSSIQDSDGKQLFPFLIWKAQSCLQSRWGRHCRSLCFSVCGVNQFLTGNAIANPGNGLKALRIDLLRALEAQAEPALADPFQCGIN